MTEKQLGQALLDLNLSAGTGAADPKQLTHKILSQDERRVRRWTWVTIVLWVLAALMVLWMFIAMGLLMPFQAKIHQEMQAREAKADGALSVHGPRLTDKELKSAQESAQVFSLMITLGVAGSVGMLGLATLSAVLLVLASRRATLRQINASLLEISEQLKTMRAGPSHG
ncbi:MAG: hypothetical protein WD851_17530 [Pirellulales bacterium]